MQIGTYETHPAADVFPLLEGVDFDALCEDIKAHGLRDPIVRAWVDSGAENGTRKPLVLDGRNRLRACLKVGVTPHWRDYEGADHVAFVVSANLHRRHLSESQRAMIGARIANLPHGRSDGFRGNQHTGGKRPIGRLPDSRPFEAATQAAIAKQLNVSERSVRRARRVLEQGDQETVNAIERGEMSVGEAEKVAAEALQQTRAKNVERKPAEETCRRDSKGKPRKGVKSFPDVDARDAKIKPLLEAGHAANEIASMLGVSSNAVHDARRRLGLRPERNPLGGLTDQAIEFSDAFEVSLSIVSDLSSSATDAQRKELVGHLEELVKVTRRLIHRLNKEAVKEEIAS